MESRSENRRGSFVYDVRAEEEFAQYEALAAIDLLIRDEFFVKIKSLTRAHLQFGTEVAEGPPVSLLIVLVRMEGTLQGTDRLGKRVNRMRGGGDVIKLPE